ncbi:MAG: DUF4255 domain-containing protein [Promicromonosporaceae bacterium]|nr:DUF4255 domain-containing protein [Promicromonosporaceae bacterium]
MITEVDAALRAVVRSAVGDVDVAFDAPTKDWAARRNAPTVDVYLYDLREEQKLRETGQIERRAADGTVTRTPPPRHFRLSYLVTAWTQRPEDEHRLLDAVLARLVTLDRLPPEHLAGDLAALGLPVPVASGLPPAEERGFADVWTSLGGELRPSLDVVVRAPLAPAVQLEAGPPVRERLRLGVVDRLGTARDEAFPDRSLVEPVETPPAAPPPRARARRRTS